MPGVSSHAEDSIDGEYMEAKLIEALAKGIAQRQQHWAFIEQLADGDVTLVSKTLAGLRAPPIPRH